MTILIDVTHITDEATDIGTESMYKAMGEGGDGIWEPMENTFIAHIVELFTQRGLLQIAGVQKELNDWLSGAKHRPVDRPVAFPGDMDRWGAEEIELVKLYLSSINPASMQPEDYDLMIEYLAQRYFPPAFRKGAAEWMATKTAILGKLEAHLGTIDSEAAKIATSEAPGTLDDAAARFALSQREQAIMKFSRTRCAENIQSLTDSMKARIKSVIVNHAQAEYLGDKAATAETLQTKLFDKFSDLNRDWRRIAVTEAVENSNQGLIASLPLGTHVKRLEVYKTACQFCRSLHNREFEVVDPAKPIKNPETQVWVGKTNIGRSAAPMKRVGGTLIARNPSELYWPAAGAQHPHCFISHSVPIYTIDGWKPINKIAVGDLVLTHNGKFKAVNWVLQNAKHTGTVYDVRVDFKGKNAFDLPTATGEHPVLTDNGWVAISNLKVGDRIKAMAKTCPTCGGLFVDGRNRVNYCNHKCVPHSGENQFTNTTPEQYAIASAITTEGNKRRMMRMTVEQRRELTQPARAKAKELGHSWLADKSNASVGAKTAASKNYTPSDTELAIAEMLDCLGFEVDLQHRVRQTTDNSVGRARYWFLDLALPDQKIAIEIDGDPWHGKLNRGNDERKNADLKALGWTVLRFDSAKAKQEPHLVAEAAARLAMNHNDEYAFDYVTVVSIAKKEVTNKKLYNFGVDDDESYIAGKGIVFHNCRGQWLPLTPIKSVDPDFTAWAKSLLEKK